jgi:hypothetical protein
MFILTSKLPEFRHRAGTTYPAQVGPQTRTRGLAGREPPDVHRHPDVLTPPERGARRYLKDRAFPRPFTRVLHYSPVAARARAERIRGHEMDFEQFRGSVSLQAVLATAEEALNASVPASLRDETLSRLAGRQLSESQQQIIFDYKLAFEATGLAARI